jgi:hypothetical protein
VKPACHRTPPTITMTAYLGLLYRQFEAVLKEGGREVRRGRGRHPKAEIFVRFGGIQGQPCLLERWQEAGYEVAVGQVDPVPLLPSCADGFQSPRALLRHRGLLPRSTTNGVEIDEDRFESGRRAVLLKGGWAYSVEGHCCSSMHGHAAHRHTCTEAHALIHTDIYTHTHIYTHTAAQRYTHRGGENMRD